MREFFTDYRILGVIRQASGTDTFDLSLQLKDFTKAERHFIAAQIAAKQKARYKIPEFYADNQIFYPSPLSVEQASSSVAAMYKAQLVNGGTLIDMTGGLGADAFYFSKKADRVIYLERDRQTSEYAAHNFGRLKAVNVEVICTDSLSYVRQMKQKAEFIYLDPSRRQEGRKVFRIEEAEPDAGAIYRELLEKAGIVIIKMSPFLDISYLIRKFEFINQIHVVATANECREILVVLDSLKKSADPMVIAWSNEKNVVREFISTFSRNDTACLYGHPETYIYDPNVAVRKTGLFNSLGREFSLKKLAPNSHLYTGEGLVENFPGRTFLLEKTMTFRELLREKSLKQANIAVRNFHIKPDEIRKRSGIREGGEVYIFCTTNLGNEPVVLVTRKVDVQ